MTTSNAAYAAGAIAALASLAIAITLVLRPAPAAARRSAAMSGRCPRTLSPLVPLARS